MSVSYNHPPTESGIFRSSGPAKPGNRAIKPKYSTYRAKTAGSFGRISITNISSNDANSDDSRVPPHLNRQKVSNSQSTIYDDTSERRNQSRSDGNMFNILLGGEFPNGDNHSPERRTTAENIKYFIEIPKKYLKAHSFELMGFSPEEVPVNDHDPVQNRLDNERFVKRQARLGYDKKQFSFLKKQVDKIISSSENATILGKELNLLPSNSNTLKMNVKNDTNIPDATMTDAIRNIGWKTLPNCVKQLREKKTEIDYIKSVRFIDGNFKNAREPGPGTDLREEAEHYFNVLLELDELILQVIICIIIGNARVFGNKAHFVNAREGRILHLIKNSVLDGILDGYNAPTLQRVEGNILEIFDNKQIQIENEPARFFELQEVPVTAGRFLWARVYYRKGKALKKAAKHYKMYFLQPADELTSFEESGSLLIDGRQFIVANAIVDVASKKVPNKYAIASVLLTNLEYYGEKAICDNPQPETDAIRFYSQHSKETAAESARYEDENFKDCYASKLEKLKGMRPNKQLTDFTEMTSVVKFCHQYCNICHSTEHSLTNCEKKGCKLCLNKNHLVWKCTNRCKCGKGAHHLKNNCPSKKGNSKEDEKREFATAALGKKIGANDESPTTGQTQVSQQTNVAHETTQVTAQNENDPIVSKRHASLRNLSEDSQRLEDVITPQAPKVITGDESEGKKRKDNNHQEASSSVSEETQYVETQKDTESEFSKDQSSNTQHTDPEESNISYQENQANTAPSAFLASIASRVKCATPAVSILCPVTINSQGAFIPNLNFSEEIPSSLNRLLIATVDNHHPSPSDR